MPPQEILAPGTALNDYMHSCEQLLDHYVHGNISWSTLFDRHQAAVARLNGQLADRFLIRAHNRRVNSNPDGPPRDVRAEAGQ
jgi:hypothetical protein